MLKKTHFEKCSLTPPNFHPRPPTSSSYESWYLQLKFDTLLRSMRLKLQPQEVTEVARVQAKKSFFVTIVWSCEKWHSISWPISWFHPPGFLGLKTCNNHDFALFLGKPKQMTKLYSQNSTMTKIINVNKLRNAHFKYLCVCPFFLTKYTTLSLMVRNLFQLLKKLFLFRCFFYFFWNNYYIFELQNNKFIRSPCDKKLEWYS